MPPKSIRAAIGFSVHSGWGAVVVVTGTARRFEILRRLRIAIIEPHSVGTKQPYHYAAELDLPAGKLHIQECARNSTRLARSALATLIGELDDRAIRVAGAAILMSSARQLPALAAILAAHPLIHTAEGIFFRECFAKACFQLKIPVTAIREKELPAVAVQTFASRAPGIQKQIESMKKQIGAPWTRDEKMAARAALIALADPGARRQIAAPRTLSRTAARSPGSRASRDAKESSKQPAQH